MESRLTLHKILKKILGTDNVYFQPPESIKLSYPCIIYNLDGTDNLIADNSNYIKNKKYEITLIHKDPDNDIWEKIENLEYCKFNNSFTNDNLYHYVFTIFI